MQVVSFNLVQASFGFRSLQCKAIKVHMAAFFTRKTVSTISIAACFKDRTLLRVHSSTVLDSSLIDPSLLIMMSSLQRILLFKTFSWLFKGILLSQKLSSLTIFLKVGVTVSVLSGLLSQQTLWLLVRHNKPRLVWLRQSLDSFN